MHAQAENKTSIGCQSIKTEFITYMWQGTCTTYYNRGCGDGICNYL